MKSLSLAVFGAAVLASPLFASLSVELTSPASSIQLGETLTFTAFARDSSNSQAQFTYQFTYRPGGSGPFVILKDFYSGSNTFSWTPSSHEGIYDVGVSARSATGQYASASETIYVTSRVTSGRPVVSDTNNTLVALYSAPPCAAPGQVRVHFGPQGALNNHEQFTPFQPCNGLSVNFYIAGMTQNTTYIMQQQELIGASVIPGPLVAWRSGGLPSTAHLPSHVRLLGPESPTAVNYPLLMRSSIGGATPFATDLHENVVWYAGWVRPNDTGLLTHLLPGGYFLAIQDQFFREFDMAGNTLLETNYTAVQTELNNIRVPQHKPPVILNQFSHEGIQLPNGDLATLVTDEQIKNQGSGNVDVLGDAVVVLNSGLQVVWYWDAFDHLDINRLARVTPYTCTVNQGGCPARYYNIDPATHQTYRIANDWTHANAVSYDPSDGNLLVSFRNQSWIIKVAYENGRGDGHIIWTLGYGGNFALASGYPVTDWFSGQHNAQFQSNGLLTLFDNNNASPASDQPGGDSHGQAWRLDTTHMIATPVINFDLESSSQAIGSATLLSNGNYEFNSGFIESRYTQITEFTPSGAVVYKEQTDGQTYRSFRLRDLYTP